MKNYLLASMQQEWKNFKYSQPIEMQEIENIWTCFNLYVKKIQEKRLLLKEYTNRVENTDMECNYLCQFIERDSNKYFAAAKPGSANNYGIKMNNDDTYFCSKKITKTTDIDRVNYNEAEKYYQKIIDYLYETVNEKVA